MNKIVLLAIFAIPFNLFCQQEEIVTGYRTLINGLNNVLKEYESLSPYHDEYYPLSDFELTEAELDTLVAMQPVFERGVNATRDSVESNHMIQFLQKKIFDQIEQVVTYPEFLETKGEGLYTDDDLTLAISPDGRLINFSLFAKTGGTYKSCVSQVYFGDRLIESSEEREGMDYVFRPDGYEFIDTIHSEKGLLYVMSGDVGTCSMCMFRYLDIYSFNDDLPNRVDRFSLESFGHEGDLYFESETRQIMVDYETVACDCENPAHEFDFIVRKDPTIQCGCSFHFNGAVFELMEKSSISLEE